jgi:hypothetical protein
MRPWLACRGMTSTYATRQMRAYAAYLDGQVAWSDLYSTIRTQVLEEGCNTEGFTGLLDPLGRVVRGPLHEGVDALLSVAQHKLYGMANGLREAANLFDGVEETNADKIDSVDNHRPDYH